MLRHRIVPDEQPRGERESVVVVRLLLLLFLGVVLPSRTDDGIGYKRKKKMRRARARDDDDDTILSEGDLKVRSFPLESSSSSSLITSSRVKKEYFKARTKNVLPSLRCQSIFACVRIFPRGGVPVDLTERLAPRRRTVMMMIPMMLHLFVSLYFCPFKGTVRRTTERDALLRTRLSSKNGSFCKKSIYENETKQAVRDKKKTSSSTVSQTPTTTTTNARRCVVTSSLLCRFFFFFLFPFPFFRFFFSFFFHQSKKRKEKRIINHT